MASAESYYQAMDNKDLAGMVQHLHPDVRFIGPMADWAGKEAVLEAARRLLTLIKSIGVHAKLGSGDQAMLTW